MPDKNIDRVKQLLSKVSEVKLELEELLAELESPKKATDKNNYQGRRSLQYAQDSTFKQKVELCLKLKRRELSINDMVEILCNADAELRKDEKKTNNAVRLAVFRMVKDKELIEHRYDNRKMIHYGLPQWEDKK